MIWDFYIDSGHVFVLKLVILPNVAMTCTMVFSTSYTQDECIYLYVDEFLYHLDNCSIIGVNFIHVWIVFYSHTQPKFGVESIVDNLLEENSKIFA